MSTAPLAVNVPQPSNILGEAGQAFQLRNLINQQQLFPIQKQMLQGQADIQQQDLAVRKIQVQDMEGWRNAMLQASQDHQAGSIPSGTSFMDHVTNLAEKNGVSFNSLVEHRSQVAQLNQHLAATEKDQVETMQKQSDNLRGALTSIRALPDEQQEDGYNNFKHIVEANPAASLTSYGLQELPPWSNQKDLDLHIASAVTGSELAKEAAEAKQAAGREAIGAAETSREAFEERMRGQVTPEDIFREQQANARAGTRLTSQGETPVIGVNAQGKQILTSQADAQARGLKQTMKADSADVTKSQAARQWLPLVDKIGNAPETMGIQQLLDRMDKKGELGVLGTRWQDFLAGRLGAGADPDFTALRTKLGLSNTLLMNLHVGNRGASALLEHFEDLANSKRMNAATLKTALGSEYDYAKDRAMQEEPAARHIRYDPQGVAYEWNGQGDGSDPQHWTRLP